MSTFIGLMTSLICLVLPVALAIALVSWLVRRGRRAEPTRIDALNAFDTLLARWEQAQQISPAAATELRSLLAAERSLVLAPVMPMVPAAAASAVSPPMPAPAPGVRTVPVSGVGEAAMVTVPPVPAVPPPQPRRTLGDRFGQALLALRTRQTLLFLGAFLLFISALILIVFNWASFSPILQFALIAGVCSGFWAGGAWLIRNTDLDRAGAGLQAVGGVLVPVVAFSLSRPGLLELAPRSGWLLASVLCIPIYMLAAWRLRRPLYAGAASLSLASAVLAALDGVDGVDVAWLPFALLLTLAALLPLTRVLQQRAAVLAPGPRWVAHVGAPLALFASLLLSEFDPTRPALAGALWAGAGFYTLALLLTPRMVWAWAAAALPPLALLATLATWGALAPWWAVAPALLLLVYLGVALALEPRAGARVLPAYAGALVLVLFALVGSIGDAVSARWGLPLLLAAALVPVLAAERGRLVWLTRPVREIVTALAFGSAAALLAAWCWVLLGVVAWAAEERALAEQVLAALFVVAATELRQRRLYDLALQVVGSIVALIAVLVAFGHPGLHAPTLTGLAVIGFYQALRHRSQLWAAATLGILPLAGMAWLVRFMPHPGVRPVAELALGFAAVYFVGGAWLRRGVGRYWSWSALGWGALAAAVTLLLIGADLAFASAVQPWQVLMLLALASTLALASGLWRAAWPGALVALLFAAALLLAATRGFFTSWRPATADFGLIIAALTLGLVLLGQALRRVAARYAPPYELVGFALLTFAPLPTIGDARAATLTWAAMLALYTAARWLYRLRWATAPALLALDLALLNGTAWLVPGGRPAGAALILLGAAWFQGVLALVTSRKAQAQLAQRFSTIQPAAAVACLSGLGALTIALRADDMLAIVGFGLAALLALWATLRHNSWAAWGMLPMLAIGLAAFHHVLALGPLWSMAWGVAEALLLCMLGWAIEYVAQHPRTTSAHTARAVWAAPWAMPLSNGPLAAGLLLTAALASAVLRGAALPPLTFALATCALLLATMAVRRHAAVFAYAAAGALMVAGLCQLYDWGFRQPQWFVLPAGLYLLALGACVRRFQQQRQLAQLLETGALLLMLGVSLGQSLRTEGIESQAYAAWLCVEALALLGYGVLAKLRAPFVGGLVFFVIGVLWLSADPLLALNKWVLLGMLGLLLVGAYLLLERRQQELIRAGRALIDRVSSWG